MRKVLLFALCVAASVVAQAQPTVNNSWTKSQTVSYTHLDVYKRQCLMKF